MKTSIFPVLYIICNVSSLLAVPLSGTYTIDSTSAATSTNFTSWAGFRNTLVSSGVSGPVTVDVLCDKTETAQIDFPTINGSSSVNFIQINGNGHLLSIAKNDAVILFSGADYIYLDSLIVRNTSTNSSALGLRFYNGSNYNRITRCVIQYSGYGGGNLNSGAYIAFANSPDNLIASSNTNTGNNNLIQGNLLETISTPGRGPSFGILIVGNASDYASTGQNNTIRGNRIHNFYYIGIYMFKTNGNHISANEITRRNADTASCYSTIYGIYSNMSHGTDRMSRIDSNVIHRLPFDSAVSAGGLNTFYGIYTNMNIGSVSKRFSVSSNVIGIIKASKEIYLTYNSYNSHLDLLNNIAYNANLPVPSNSNSLKFNGFYNAYTAGSYRMNGNIIRECEGAYYWYGIQNQYPEKATDVQEINNNTIYGNIKSGYYRYGIYSYYADKSNNLAPVHIKNNLIRNNSNDGNFHYGIYCNYYGTYMIEDNIIDSNSSLNLNLTPLYTGMYCNVSIRRNLIRNNLCNSSISGIVYGIYVYQNYNAEISGNLLYGNSGYYQTYGLSVESTNSGKYEVAVTQNTVVMDGNLSSVNGNSYAVNLICNYSKLKFKGNILDVQNYGNSFFNFMAYDSFICDYNSFYTPPSAGTQIWKTISEGNSATDTGFIRLVNGNQNYIADSGHYFNSMYASSLFKNQDNVPTPSNNMLDVYGVSRNANYSDRGAVEYSGPTSLLNRTKLKLSYIYPNPIVSGILNLFNADQSSTFNLYDLKGCILLSGDLHSGNNQIDLKSLVPGIYWIELRNGLEVMSLQLMIAE